MKNKQQLYPMLSSISEMMSRFHLKKNPLSVCQSLKIGITGSMVTQYQGHKALRIHFS